MKGKFILYLGSMKAGKSSKLIEKVDKAKYRNKAVCIVRPIVDTRDYVSRAAVNLTSIDFLTCDKLEDIKEQLLKYDIICIDEGQFITDLGVMSHFLALQDKEVFCAALSGDTDMKPWEAINNAIPYADDIIRLSAICDCCNEEKPTYSYFVGEKKDKIVIGDDQYKAYCRYCYDRWQKTKGVVFTAS